jgi:hypothetical protein
MERTNMTDKDQKKKLKDAFKAKECQSLEASMPLSKSDLKALFDYLDETMSSCDHSLTLTTDFLNAHSLNLEKIIPWLREHGGYCDCEVLGNVEEKFEDIL